MMQNELLRLKLLRERFPQLSNEDVADAYTRSGRNFEDTAAALKSKWESLVAEHRKDGWIKVTNSNHKNRQGKNGTTQTAGGNGNAKKKKQRNRHSKNNNDGTTLEQPSKPAGLSNLSKGNGNGNAGFEQGRQHLEQFLFSMLGDDVDLGMDVVRDVIHQCDGDAQKVCVFPCSKQKTTCAQSLDSLLDIAVQSGRTPKERLMDDPQLLGLLEAFPAVDAAVVIQLYQELGGDVEMITNKLLDSAYRRTLDADVQRSMDRLRSRFPNADATALMELLRAHDYDFSATMETLDGVVAPPAANHIVTMLPEANLVKPSEVKDPPKLRMVMPKPVSPAVKPPIRKKPPTKSALDEWAEYKKLCQAVTDNWATMKLYFQEATNAYHHGDRVQATALSKKGQEFKRLSREARERVSNHVFEIHNKEYQNNITIDLHHQHVDEAIKMVDDHLKALGSIIRSVKTLTLITGHGVHATDGKPKLKTAIVSYLKSKGVDWVEINPGRMLVNLDTLKTAA